MLSCRSYSSSSSSRETVYFALSGILFLLLLHNTLSTSTGGGTPTSTPFLPPPGGPRPSVLHWTWTWTWSCVLMSPAWAIRRSSASLSASPAPRRLLPAMLRATPDEYSPSLVHVLWLPPIVSVPGHIHCSLDRLGEVKFDSISTRWWTTPSYASRTQIIHAWWIAESSPITSSKSGRRWCYSLTFPVVVPPRFPFFQTLGALLYPPHTFGALCQQPPFSLFTEYILGQRVVGFKTCLYLRSHCFHGCGWQGEIHDEDVNSCKSSSTGVPHPTDISPTVLQVWYHTFVQDGILGF